MLLNFTNVESKAFEVLPVGKYGATIKKAEIKDNKAGDGKYVNLQLEIESPDSGKAVSVFDIFSLKQSALWKLKGFLDILGVDTSGEAEIDWNDMIGSQVIVDIIMDTYEGTERNKIKKYEKPAF